MKMNNPTLLAQEEALLETGSSVSSLACIDITGRFLGSSLTSLAGSTFWEPMEIGTESCQLFMALN